MDECWGGATRRDGLPLRLDSRSITVSRCFKADRLGAIARGAASKSRAIRMKEPGD
jgi:hypothetical protein